MKNIKRYFYLFLILLTMMSYVLINYTRVTSLIISFYLIFLIWNSYKGNKKNLLLLSVALILGVTNIIIRNYILYVLFDFLLVVIIFYDYIVSNKDKINIIKIFLMLLLVIFLINSISPNLFCKSFRVKFRINEVDRLEESVSKIEDNITVRSNIMYDKEYPNSYLDVYLKDSSYPTLIYVHGGGFVGGDKNGEELLNERNLFTFFNYFFDNDYNIISINYPLAPEYKYPIAIKQVNKAIKYLVKNGKEFGINMDNVVLGGSSAGSQLVGQFVNITTNEDYRVSMGMEQAIDPSSIKAVVLNAPLLDPLRLTKTSDPLIDYVFSLMGRAYFDVGFLSETEDANEANVINHVNNHFPPVFISDGNFGSFGDQAEDLHEKLDKLGVENEYNTYSIGDAVLTHEFNYLNTKYAVDNNTKMMNFVNRYVNR